MGDLDLAVRDELNQTNLWQFAGVSAGLGLDRDSTSLELWIDGRRSTVDVEQDGLEQEVTKGSGSQYAMEGAIRFSETLALGLDAGLLSTRHAELYDATSNSSTTNFEPVALVVASGRFFGPVLWGLSAPFAGGSYSREWLQNQQDGSRVVIDDNTFELAPPNFFFPDEGEVDIGGLAGSIAVRHPQGVEAAFYLEKMDEEIALSQEGLRHVYDTFEDRDISDFGFAFVGRVPDVQGELGVALGRSTFSAKEDFRFSISGGATGLPAQGRGDRTLKSYRADYFEVRAQIEDLVRGLTLGGDFESSYQHANEGPATTQGNFNDYVLSSVTSDTLAAPPLVQATVLESRVLGYGLGASYAIPDRPVLVGVEYRWRRDAQDGTSVERRPQGWSLRAGGEWVLNPAWTARLGYVHEATDADRLTAANEAVADRFTLGGSWAPGSGWTTTLFGQRRWGRTDFESPLGPLETGWGLGLQVGRVF